MCYKCWNWRTVHGAGRDSNRRTWIWCTQLSAANGQKWRLPPAPGKQAIPSSPHQSPHISWHTTRCCAVGRIPHHATRSPCLARLQACWALFPGYSSDPVLCLLGAGCLTTAAAGGELQEAAVPQGLEDLWPAGEAGVLLGVRGGNSGKREQSNCAERG